MVGMGIKYSITNLGTQKKPCNTKLYDSETKKYNQNSINNNTMTFFLFKIPVMFLNPSGNANENIVSIQITDVVHKRLLGEYKGPISRLLVPDAIEFAFRYFKSIYKMHNRKSSYFHFIFKIRYEY